MPSRTIRPTQAPVAAPFPYTVAAPDGFTPEAVFASWDGSGAGGDFLPCVSYYNADGVLLDRAFPDGVTLHPGDTAEVSYRPFRRTGGGGGGSGPTAATYAYGRFASATNPPDFDVPIVTQGLAGVSIGIGGQWVIGKAGLYVVTLDAYVGLPGGNPANAEAALFLYNFTHPPETVRLSLVTAAPIPIGTAAQVRAASTRLVPLAAGDTLGLQLSENVFATKASTDDGHVGLYRIA